MSLLKGLLKESEDILSKQDESYNSAFLGADLELDGSRRREISLYRNGEVVLTVEHGVTLGLLKLIYSSDSKFQGILQGVRSRTTSDPSAVTSAILSDERVLDRDEYDLVVQESNMEGNFISMRNQQLHIQEPSTNTIFISNHNNNNNNNNNEEKKKGQFVCEYCHLPFVSRAKFQRHRRIHTEENPYICVYCNEAFPHHLDLRKHREEQHMLNKPFKCSCCPKTFATRAELRGHLWRHTGEKNHKCRICSKTFATKGNLKLHVDKHIGVHKHKCPFCPQRFTSHSSLEAHMAKHTGLKAYKCRFCTKSYAQAGQLTAHERLHTGEKPFVCGVCGKRFRLNSTRLSHEKRHSGARPHLCSKCGRSFAMPDHLRRHMKTHEDKLDRIVSCPFCKKKIFQGRNMRKHLFRHRELNLTDIQAKIIAASLKPDRQENERDELEDEQKSRTLNGSGKKSLQCERCNMEIKSIRKLFDHLSQVHYQRELTPIERKEIRLRYGVQKLHHCQFCFSYFLDYRLLRSHVLSIHPEHAENIGFTAKTSTRTSSASHKCPNCSLYFDLRSTLDEHIIKDHLTTVVRFASNGNDQVLQFRCWYCSDNFHSPEEVVAHMTNQHESLDVLSKRVEMTDVVSENSVSSTGLWACPHCPLNLKTENEYKAHVSSHSQPSDSCKVEGTCTTVQRLSNSVSHTSGSNIHDVNSYLNPIDGNDSEASTDCVVKKYLKSDPVSQTARMAVTSSELKVNETNAASSFTTNISDCILDNLNQAPVITASVVDRTSDINLNDANTEIGLTNCHRHFCDTVDSSVLVSSTTPDAYRSSENSSTSNVCIPNMHTSTSTEIELRSSNISQLNASSSMRESDNTSLSGIACMSPAVTLNTHVLPNFSTTHSGSPLVVSSSATLNMSSIEMAYDSSVDFHRTAHVTPAIRDDSSTLGKSSVAEVKDNEDNSSETESKVNQEITTKETYPVDVKLSKASIPSPSEQNSFEKRNKVKKKKKNKEKRKLKERLEAQNIACDFMESCRFCSDVFKNKNELNNHLKVAHNNEDGASVPFRCWFCTVTFTSPEDVVAHMTNVHDNLDNLSRRVEMTELKNQMAAEKESCRLKLLKLDDASLSPVDSLKCPKCPKKLESKEAYELHMIVHEASHNTDLLRTGTDLLNRYRCSDRPSINSNAMDEVSLPGDQINIDDQATGNFASEHFDLTSKHTIVSTACVSSNMLPKNNDSSVTMVTREKVEIISTPVKESSLTITEVPVDSRKKDFQPAKIVRLTKVDNASKKDSLQPSGKKKCQTLSKEKQQSPKEEKTLVIDTNINMCYNMCSHCARVFCTKRALDVHTFKMHGKEYLQKRRTLRSSTPFNCWFCSAHFPSTELVVEHMTNSHENLDSLSKRIEEQDIPSSSRLTIVDVKSKKLGTAKLPKVAQQNSPIQTSSESNQQPPRGFKMSYALAYVPVYIPERNEKVSTDEGKDKQM